MKIKNIFLSGLLIFTLAGRLMAQDKVAITIYNQNLALVNETRKVTFPKGRGRVGYPNVAERIHPTSVQITIKTSPNSLKILEQNFEYDLVSSAKIFQRYLDEKVSIKTKKGDVLKGTLLSASGGDIVLQAEDGSLQVVMKNEIVTSEFPKLPEGLITRPTLVWDCQNSGAGKREIEVSYLTSGINWHAEYVGVLNTDDSRMRLNGWVSIDNKSGATYRDAKLKLVAGDIHLLKERIRRERTVLAMTAERAQPDFEEKAFFEYHLYTLRIPTTIKNNQQKQITFIPQSDAIVEKLYQYEGQRNPRNVVVLVKFENKKTFGLGIPLPAGKVRIYKADEDESLLFVGEDQLQHTPKDEEIRLTIGNAFDIIGERQRVSERKLGRRSREQTFKIELRNHKEEAVNVTVLERFRGDWEIREASKPVAKKTAEKAEWILNIPANGEAELQFTVLMRW